MQNALIRDEKENSVNFRHKKTQPELRLAIVHR
jgi:hypothetical protein